MVLRQHLQLGGNLGNFLISFMVLIEVPIHKYFSEPQNYNPDIFKDISNTNNSDSSNGIDKTSTEQMLIAAAATSPMTK